MRSITELADFREPLLMARNTGHRLMLVLAMAEERGMRHAQQLTHTGSSSLWVDVQENDQVLLSEHRHISAVQASQYLGVSNHYVIYNAYRGFNASAFYALSGTIMAGGVLILLTPATSEWHKNFDVQLQAYGHSASNAHSCFIKWWQQQWQHHRAVYVLQDTWCENKQQLKTTTWQSLPNLPKTSKNQEPTGQQQTLIMQLVTAYDQQSAVVVTIDAHRGRGKSACLGWLIKSIGKDAKYGPIVVTAPSKRALGSMIQTAAPQIVNFYALDALSHLLPKAGLVIVDEAAAIPLPQLIKIINHYDVVVLSSTQDGYEGSGQGYRIKLPRIISSLGRTSKAMTLTEPIRWQANDPLEEFIRSSLLCNVTVPDTGHEFTFDPELNVTYTQLTGKKLSENNGLLRQVYPLLMLAHYQTTPQDLRLLLDHPQHKIHLCHVGDLLVGLAWVAEEGSLDATLAQHIALGKRRINGHLLAQILAQQAGFTVACEMRSWRIQRLVVRPSLQGKGFGSELLKQIYGLAKDAQVDFVGASFSASADTLHFWRANNFLPAWLGLRADAATGLNSVQVMRPISLRSRELIGPLMRHLRDYLNFGKGMWFASVDDETWQNIYSACSHPSITALNAQHQQRLLTLLAKGQAGFSGPLYLLHQKLHDEKDKQLVMNAAQNNTHKGLQRGVRHLALSLLKLPSNQ